MSTDKGYVRVYRDIQKHWVWKDKPFSRGQAWIDLIMLVNHQDNTIPVDGRPFMIKRGEHLTSIKILADKWGWSRGKVRRFLDDLKKEQMIDKKRHGNGTLISLVKYGEYQCVQHTEQHTCGHPAAILRQSDGHKQYMNEDTKEDTKKNKDLPTQSEFTGHVPDDSEITWDT